MCMTKHTYGSVDATRRVKTDYGTYYLCDDCAESMCQGGYVVADDPVDNPTRPFACQCEHVDHDPAREPLTDNIDLSLDLSNPQEG